MLRHGTKSLSPIFYRLVNVVNDIQYSQNHNTRNTTTEKLVIYKEREPIRQVSIHSVYSYMRDNRHLSRLGQRTPMRACCSEEPEFACMTEQVKDERHHLDHFPSARSNDPSRRPIRAIKREIVTTGEKPIPPIEYLYSVQMLNMSGNMDRSSHCRLSTSEK